MLHFASQTSLSWYWLWHPLQGPGYQFWSGLGSDISEITIFAAIISIAVGWYRHHNCRVDGCRHIGFQHPDHGQPMCSRHHLTTPSALQRHHGLPGTWHEAKALLNKRETDAQERLMGSSS